MAQINVEINCVVCGEKHSIMVEDNDFVEFTKGKLAQTAFPYLTPEERELFISQMCPECFNKVVPNEVI